MGKFIGSHDISLAGGSLPSVSGGGSDVTPWLEPSEAEIHELDYTVASNADVDVTIEGDGGLVGGAQQVFVLDAFTVTNPGGSGQRLISLGGMPSGRRIRVKAETTGNLTFTKLDLNETRSGLG